MKMVEVAACPLLRRIFLTCALLAMVLPALAAGVRQSGLPVPPAKKKVAKPKGVAGGLKVLDWAGFQGAVSYTFDDALPSQAANYPQLQASGVRMTFFLNANDKDTEIWAQAFKDGHELGNHTAHHCRADGSACTGWSGSIETEYDQCTEYIRRIAGAANVWTTASPYGDTGYDEVAKTRFFLNRGVQRGLVAPNDASDPHNLPIFSAAQGDTAAAFNPQIDAARSSGTWLIFLFHSLGGDGGYAPIDPAELFASVNHAKAAGDLWIDSMVNVGAYWAGQKALAQATSSQSGRNTVLHWTLPPHFPAGKYLRATVTGGKLKQNGHTLKWHDAGYYEIALDAGELTIAR